jgi:hypothetical protein
MVWFPEVRRVAGDGDAGDVYVVGIGWSTSSWSSLRVGGIRTWCARMRTI